MKQLLACLGFRVIILKTILVTTKDMENWKKGFPFQLPSIRQEKEFRRTALINEIKSRLVDKRRLLLVGESGTSKTTLLMEILTDYFDEGYEILYNLDASEIKNGPQVARFINKRLQRGDKILVIVDNVHSVRTSPIFYAMDEISSSIYIQNIMFLLAARIPEYDSFVKDRLNQVKEGKESIRKLSKDSDFRYDLSYFTKDEITGFIKKYKCINDSKGQDVVITAEGEEYLSDYSQRILKETSGNPIMVKFSLLKDGLHADVERRYDYYLSSDPRKMQITLVCSLLDIWNLRITDQLLQDMGFLREAYDLENATLHRFEGFWKTIHSRWDEELLSFLYNKSEKGRLLDNVLHLKTALDSIFNIKEKNTSATQKAYSVIGTIYDIGARHFIPIDVIESVSSIPSYLTNEQKAEYFILYRTDLFHT